MIEQVLLLDFRYCRRVGSLLTPNNKFPVKDLYLNFDTLAIPELHTRQLLILVHKFLHHPHLLPTAFANYFTSNSRPTIHQHNTREKENLHLTSVSKDVGKRSVKYKASKLWNQLPISLKDYCSVKQFGSKLKIYLQLADIVYDYCMYCIVYCMLSHCYIL